MVSMARLALALLGWTPCLLLVSPLPSQVPGEAHRTGRGPGEATEAPVVMPCPALPCALPGLGSLWGREGVRALDREGDRQPPKRFDSCFW